MNTFAKLSAVSILAVAAVATVTAIGQNNQKMTPDKMVGKAVPTFSMKSTAGKTINNSSIKGKVVVLDFWATWCGPCKAASPSMQALHKKYSSKGAMIIGAGGMENKKGPDLSAKYAKDNKYTYTFTYDNDQMMKDWGIESIPQFIIIDKKGKVRYSITGWDKNKSAAQFDKYVSALLAEK